MTPSRMRRAASWKDWAVLTMAGALTLLIVFLLIVLIVYAITDPAKMWPLVIVIGAVTAWVALRLTLAEEMAKETARQVVQLELRVTQLETAPSRNSESRV